MSSAPKRAAPSDAADLPQKERNKHLKVGNQQQREQHNEQQQKNGFISGVVMSLQCIECKQNVADRNQGIALRFLEDGKALHLVLRLSDLGKPGACFMSKDVAPEKLPSDKNPCASTSHILCDNVRPGGGDKKCGKKIGAVKCMPPHSDNKLIFFAYKAVQSAGVKYKSWNDAREGNLRDVGVMPPSRVDIGRQFAKTQRPPLIRFDAAMRERVAKSAGSGSTAKAGISSENEAVEGEGLTETHPRSYQSELFTLVMASERNALVYLPTGLGKTLVSIMAVQRMLELNPERQAYFLVETNALVIQQADKLRWETQSFVEVMVGSSFSGEKVMVGSSFPGESSPGRDESETDDSRVKGKLVKLRAAKIVVATAGAFEHAMCKQYIDPESICCVVLDEAHHCGKEHPFNRVVKQFLVPCGGTKSSSASPSASQQESSTLPKVVALTASPAGELDLPRTIVKIEELLARLGADLAAPVKTIDEVKRRSPRVDLELVLTPTTEPEGELLRALEKLVLGRIAKFVTPASDVGIQTNFLLRRLQQKCSITPTSAGVEARVAGGDADVIRGSSLATAMAAPSGDESWRFPNKTHVALLHQSWPWRAGRAGLKGWGVLGGRSAAAAVNTGPDGGGGRDRVEEADRCADKGTAVMFGADEGYLPVSPGCAKLIGLLNACLAVDEMGGDATWQWVLDFLEFEGTSSSSDVGAQKNGRVGGTRDPDRDDTIRVLKKYLPDASDESEMEVGDDVSGGRAEGKGMRAGVAPFPRRVGNAEAAAGERYVSDTEGSKLKMVASLLEEHKKSCDENDKQFSALIFVSTRKLAKATPAMLMAIPGLSDFVSADFIVGLSDLTLAQQSTAMCQFREGSVNVLVLTSVCGEGIDVPACGLVVCTALPKSGTELVQLRGRLRCGENCRFVGLSRTCGRADKDHVRTLCLREFNMMAAIETLSTGGRSADPSSRVQPGRQTPHYCTSEGNHNVSGVTIPSTVSTSNRSGSSPNGSSSAAGDAHSSDSDVTDVAKKLTKATVEGSCAEPSPANVMGATSGGKGGGWGAEVDGGQGWTKDIAPLLSPPARKYAVQYLASTTRQTIQRHGKEQNARSCLNSSIQLAQTFKPTLEYDERKATGEAHLPVFEARCILSSRTKELNGLILVKAAKGGTIKAAREAAAAKMIQVLLAQPRGIISHEGINVPSG